jgi:hypothetical protein
MKYKEFLYSVNDEKFYWRMLLPKKGLRFAKSIDEIEHRKVCLTKCQHLNMMNSIEI